MTQLPVANGKAYNDYHMRKAKLYLRTFWLTILLVIIGVVGWAYDPYNLGEFRNAIFSSALGIGISISIAEGAENLVEHRRVKRTLGFLKLISIQYINNQVENFNEFLKLNKDIKSLEHAHAFMLFVTGFDYCLIDNQSRQQNEQ